jgi:hypothetical protein
MTDVVPKEGCTTLPEAVKRIAACLADRHVFLKKNQRLLACELGFPSEGEETGNNLGNLEDGARTTLGQPPRQFSCPFMNTRPKFAASLLVLTRESIA